MLECNLWLRMSWEYVKISELEARYCYMSVDWVAVYSFSSWISASILFYAMVFFSKNRIILRGQKLIRLKFNNISDIPEDMLPYSLSKNKYLKFANSILVVSVFVLLTISVFYVPIHFCGSIFRIYGECANVEDFIFYYGLVFSFFFGSTMLFSGVKFFLVLIRSLR